MGAVLLCQVWYHMLTKLGAAHPMAADNAVMTARAATAPIKTVNRGFFMAMICVCQRCSIYRMNKNKISFTYSRNEEGLVTDL